MSSLIKHTLSASLLCLSLCLLPALAISDDRMLIIGVDTYQNHLPALEGVVKDLTMMRQVAQILGFKKHQIIELSGEQATLDNVRRALVKLARQAGQNDRIIIYFSGHGAQIADQNQDESDGADEVLLLTDSRLVTQNGQQTLDRVLVDDELNRLLKQIPSRQLVVMIDACHSGTVNKAMFWAGQNTVQVKRLDYAFTATPSAGLKGNFLAFFSIEESPENYVLLSAAHDDELAISTEHGSLFTRGLLSILQDYQQKQQALTLNRLQQELDAFIKQTVSQEKLMFHHTPQLHGNPALYQYPLLTETPPWRKELYQPASESGDNKAIKINLY